MMKNDLYPKACGQWAGNPAGTRTNYNHCCETVYDKYGRHQCTRPRGFGPDGAYCKQHAPDAVAARRAAQDAAHRAKLNKERYNWHGPTFYAVLKQIAEGHNDARQLAKDALAEFHKGER